jgi:hypothetical protein
MTVTVMHGAPASHTTRSLTGARRVVFGALLALAMATPSFAIEKLEGLPPWRVGGRMGFTTDIALFPDSTGYQVEVYLRIPPATIAQLQRDEQGRAQLRATVRLKPRTGEELGSMQEFTLLPADTLNGEGHVARMLTEEMLAEADLVLVATDALRRRVMQFNNADVSKTKLMLGDTDLADPWGLSLEDYRDTARQLEPMVNRVIAAATAK